MYILVGTWRCVQCIVYNALSAPIILYHQYNHDHYKGAIILLLFNYNEFLMLLYIYALLSNDRITRRGPLQCCSLVLILHFYPSSSQPTPQVSPI